MLQIEDIKVIGFNTLCMITMRFATINEALQTFVLLATIGYTLVRTINEIQKFNNNGKDKGTIGED
tara:strand:- start:9531 stop:9728 length:198 start_codon:yes stop_codon:yes gene_type:complete